MKLVMTTYRHIRYGHYPKYDRRTAPAIALEKCLEGLVKQVMASYRLEEMSGGFGETSYAQL